MGNFFSRIIRAYRPIKTYNYIVNRSRLFNSYDAIGIVVMIILNYSVYSITNQMMLVHCMLCQGLIAIVGDYIVQIVPAMRFMYSVILSSFALIMSIIISLILTVRAVNLSKICQMLSYYYEKYSNEDDKSKSLCIEQRKYYISWIFLQYGSIFMRTLSIYFSIQAHNFVKNKKIVRARRKKIN